MTKRTVLRMYCEKCRKRSTCTELCAPVDALLRSVETRDENNGELPRQFVEQLQTGDEWPETGKTKKRLILELYFVDNREQHEIIFITGATQAYISRVVNAEKRRIRAKAKQKERAVK